MGKIFDNTYSNASLTIPASIWNDKTVRGESKMILTLLKKFTNNGTKTCEALTGQMSRMIHTREDSIKRNMKWLHDKGHIELYKDDLSRTKWSIRYLYKEKAQTKPAASDASQLF